MNEKIGVILVNYNGSKYNSDCINSVFNSSYKNIEVIVVDNMSTDNSVKILENEFKDRIKLIKNSENLGFSKANNIGIKYAIQNGCDYIMLLNNDTIVAEDAINIMVEKAKKHNAIISPKIYYFEPKNLLWSAGANINWRKGIPSQCGIGVEDTGLYDNEREVEIATGCCLLFHKNVVSKIGYLSDEYFLYYEDTDYCIRARQSEIKIVYIPIAIIYHKVSASIGGEESPQYIYYNTRNRLIFNNKFNKRNQFTYTTYFYLTRIGKLMMWIVNGKFSHIRATYCGIKDYYSGIVGKRECI